MSGVCLGEANAYYHLLGSCCTENTQADAKRDQRALHDDHGGGGVLLMPPGNLPSKRLSHLLKAVEAESPLLQQWPRSR